MSAQGPRAAPAVPASADGRMMVEIGSSDGAIDMMGASYPRTRATTENKMPAENRPSASRSASLRSSTVARP